MCGICGIVSFGDSPVEPEMIERMASSLVHRGPDDAGYYYGQGVGFGFRRLSIIDLERGHQPLSNESGDIWVVFNGEIYNYRLLRKELTEKGHRFQTESDTEVIVHLYEEYGENCVIRLRGMFGFAIWDNRKRKLFAARDYFGIKPFYYTVSEGRFLFASEIKSILSVPEIRREVRLESLWNYLTFQYVPDPHTMFEGIEKLPPAHFLVLENGSIRIQRYWEAAFRPEDRPLSYFVEGIRERLRESVRAHMNSDVPRGAFLSSGIDSSAIVALLKEMEQVKTFTVGFEGAGAQSEIAFARETARVLGTEHRDVVISPERYLRELPRLIFYQDEPVADPSAIALYFVAELASEYITVVLSGEGADELFGGYTIYREPLALKWFDYLPFSMRRQLGQMAKMLPEGMKGKGFLLRGSKTLAERFVGNAFIFDEAMKESFVRFDPAALGLKRPMDITRPYYERASDYDAITAMQFVDIHTWLAGDILMKADKMTMANSLELRVPFLDREVFEFAARIPASLRTMGGTTKYVLREAMKTILPEPVTRRKKLGFPVPLRAWLRNEFYDWARALILASPTDHYFDKSYILRLLDTHRAGKADHARQIWTVLVFMLWHRIYVEQTLHFVSAVSERVEVRRRRMAEESASILQ